MTAGAPGTGKGEPMQIKQGDKVSFVDKYDKRQTGSYEGPAKDMPGWSVVVAKAFADLGDNRDVNCLVPNWALIKENNDD